MTPGAPQTMSQVGGPAASGRRRPVSHSPGWPLTALLVPYPLWWALGMGTIIVFVLAVPMVVHLWRRRPVRTPPGFGLWLLFLLWVIMSTGMLGLDPAGTLPGDATDRVISVGFNLAGYVVVAVALLYVGNLTEEEFPRARLVRQLGWLCGVVVAGGLLGSFFPAFEFTSTVEWLLPASVAENAFVQSLVHPAAAQVQEALGFSAGRPAAPFGYTNVWGYALTLLLPFFAVSWLARPGTRRLVGVGVIGLSVIPVIYSLNRGVWIALGVAVVFSVAWLARNGHFAGVVALLVALCLTAALLLASPLTGLVQQRLDNPHSDGIRAFTISRTLEVAQDSPVLGYGSTRRALGSGNSIAVGRNSDCAKCGNPVLGSTGQLWLLIIAQGFVGAALYVAFLLRSLWAFRRDRSALGWAGMLAVLLPLLYMFLYNALVIPLLITFFAIGLLWRNDQERQRDHAAPLSAPVPSSLGTSR
jgi:hypothetical protein